MRGTHDWRGNVHSVKSIARGIEFPGRQCSHHCSRMLNEFVELLNYIAIKYSIDPHLIAGAGSELDEESLGSSRMIHPFGDHVTPTITIKFNPSENAGDDRAFGECERRTFSARVAADEHVELGELDL